MSKRPRINGVVHDTRTTPQELVRQQQAAQALVPLRNIVTGEVIPPRGGVEEDVAQSPGVQDAVGALLSGLSVERPQSTE